uniref:Uncharacterized protein n=1 Tax=uncultured haloarchaeon TaxID=160804 RepID=A0A0K1YAZ4_9EURY|nr:hypothetical protein [uncultured haloarchaeon]
MTRLQISLVFSVIHYHSSLPRANIIGFIADHFEMHIYAIHRQTRAEKTPSQAHMSSVFDRLHTSQESGHRQRWNK